MDETVIGVVVVVFDSADVIVPCIESVLASDHAALRIVIVDNASPDNSVARLHRLATDRGIAWEERPAASTEPWSGQGILVLRSAVNLGFAGGVNAGLKALIADPAVALFWVLNPDCEVSRRAASAYARTAAAAGSFALMGGRTLYLEAPQAIQSDGGRVNRWTGVCSNVNQGRQPDDATRPDPATLDFISGANMVASRVFIERCGLMREDYFLYYEEVDWAFRRGSLPLIMCPESIVHHHGGTAIGSGSMSRHPSAFSNYFNYRNRMRFVRRFRPMALPTAYLFSVLKLLRLISQGAIEQAVGGLRGLHQLPPPPAVAQRLSPDAAHLAFGR